MPNPYAILGALALAIGLAVGGFFYGEHVDGLAWQAAAAKQKAEAAQMLAASEQKALAAEQRNEDLNNELEKAHAARSAAVDAAYAENQRLLRQLVAARRLRAPGRGGRGSDRLPAGADLAAQLASGAPVIGLSRAAALDLVRLARDADRAAEYARACHDWAVRAARH